MRAALILAALLAGSALSAEPTSTPSPSQPASFIGTAINVADLDRAVRFYTEALGLKVVATLPLGTRSETILNFPGPDLSRPDLPGSASPQPAILLMHDHGAAAPKSITHGNGFSRLVIRVADLAALAARLTALGYPHGEIRDASQGYSIMMLTDPDGFRLEIVQQKRPQAGS